MKRRDRGARYGSGKSYEIGFGKPPVHSRFKPGQSGNPRGRPKGAKKRLPDPYENDRLRAIIDEEGSRLIAIHDAQGKKTEISTKQAIVRSIVVNALKGNQRSQHLFTELVSENEDLEKHEREATFEAWVKYKNAWTQEFARHRVAQRGELSQLPHPDDVRLDFATGRVHIAGPATKEEKVAWDRWRQIRAVIEEELKEWRALRHHPDWRDNKEFLSTLAVAEETLISIDLALGGSRSVMNFLEKLNFSDIDQDTLTKKRRRRAQHSFIWIKVRAAMQKLYIAETA